MEPRGSLSQAIPNPLPAFPLLAMPGFVLAFHAPVLLPEGSPLRVEAARFVVEGLGVGAERHSAVRPAVAIWRRCDWRPAWAGLLRVSVAGNSPEALDGT